MMDPTTGSSAVYNKIRFAGQYLSPGLCKISGAAAKRKWDIRQGYGIIGGTAWFIGTELSQFTVTFELYESRDWQDWAALKPILLPLQKRAIWKSIEIEHPILQELNITAVVVESIDQPQLIDEKGIWEINVHFIEYPKRPSQGAAKVDGTQAAPDDPVETEIEARNQKIEARVNTLFGTTPTPP